MSIPSNLFVSRKPSRTADILHEKAKTTGGGSGHRMSAWVTGLL
jgi:hypothetical protein